MKRLMDFDAVMDQQVAQMLDLYMMMIFRSLSSLKKKKKRMLVRSPCCVSSHQRLKARISGTRRDRR
jgi:hypothetical protein